MKLKYCILAVAAALAGFAMISCSDDEEALMPSGIDDNPYEIDPNATDPESTLRRKFQQDHNFYLIFDRLLRQRYVGKDEQGNDIYEPEYVDLSYTVTSILTTPPQFEELTDFQDKEKAVGILEDYFLPHINLEKMRPFTIFVVKSLDTYQRDPSGGWNYDYYPSTVFSNNRYLVISVGEMLESDDDGIKSLMREGMKKWVNTMVDKYDESLDPFYEINDEYRGEYITDYYPDWDRTDLSIIYELGFLNYYDSWYGISDDEFLSYGSYCFDNFFDLAMTYDEDEVIEMYGQYDTLMKKYYMIREYIEKCGYKF